MFKEVKEFDYITIAEAKEVLDRIARRRKKRAELLYETRRALRHLKTLAKLPAEKSKELVEELLKLPQVSKKELAVKLADVMPRIPEEVRIIYAKEKVTLTPEEIQEIIDVIDKYRV
jgi:DNA-directed RNA polymerase subunit F